MWFLDRLLAPDADIDRLLPMLNAFKATATTVDRLMKRWFLVNRGYDTQHTTSRKKMRKRKHEKLRSKKLSPCPRRERVVVVGKYDETVKELWDKLGEGERIRKTV